MPRFRRSTLARRAFCALVWGLSSVALVHAQTHVFTFRGRTPSEAFGYRVAIVGDTDRDGFSDLVVGVPFRGPAATPAGGVEVISGRTGRVLWEWRGGAAFDEAGAAVAAAGDVNRDGYADVLVGARGADATAFDSGAVFVLSGRSGKPLARLAGGGMSDYLGHSVVGIGDVDRDGWPDVAAGATQEIARGKGGYVRVFSGRWIATRQGPVVLYTVVGRSGGDRLGWSLAAAGDVDRDGRPDFVAGAPQTLHAARSGYAMVVSGATGRVVRLLSGDSGADQLGWSVASVGDVDRDGWPDVAAGAVTDSIGARRGAGSVVVFSGRTGARLRTIYGDGAGDGLGHSVAGAGDVDGDGHADVIAGAWHDDDHGPDSGSVRVISGRTGKALWIAFGDRALDHLGIATAGGGDLDGDGVPDVVGSAARASYVRVFSARPALLEADVHAISLSAGGEQRLAVAAGAGRAFAGYWVLGSASGTRPGLRLHGIAVPLNFDGYLEATLQLANSPPLIATVGRLDSSGRARAAIRLPPGLPPALAGIDLAHAAVLLSGSRVVAASRAAPLALVR